LSLAELATDPIEATRRIAAFLELDQAAVRDFTFEIANTGGAYEPFCDESNRLMHEAFTGLTERTDALVGRPLDWSL